MLERIIAGDPDGAIELIVVANGCTDDTARVAASVDPRVTVVEIAEAVEDRRARTPAMRHATRVAAGVRRRRRRDRRRRHPRARGRAGRRGTPLVAAPALPRRHARLRLARAPALPHLGALGLPHDRAHRFGRLRGIRRRTCPLGRVPRGDRRRPVRAAALRARRTANAARPLLLGASATHVRRTAAPDHPHRRRQPPTAGHDAGRRRRARIVEIRPAAAAGRRAPVAVAGARGLRLRVRRAARSLTVAAAGWAARSHGIATRPCAHDRARDDAARPAAREPRPHGVPGRRRHDGRALGQDARADALDDRARATAGSRATSVSSRWSWPSSASPTSCATSA